MVARVKTVAFQGIDCQEVDVEVQMGLGMPAFVVVGLADKAVGESRERVRAALHAIGLALPIRITVNLAPADLLKEGSHFDLPIALGLLIVMGVLPAEELAEFTVLGELGLDGRITAVSGVLPAAIAATAAGRGLICPAAQGGEATWAGDLTVLAPSSLIALVNHFKGSQLLGRPQPQMQDLAEHSLDLADIKGQESAKRALEVAAAGGHNLLLFKPIVPFGNPGKSTGFCSYRPPGSIDCTSTRFRPYLQHFRCRPRTASRQSQPTLCASSPGSRTADCWHDRHRAQT